MIELVVVPVVLGAALGLLVVVVRAVWLGVARLLKRRAR